jgi:L-serine dehydratase
MFTLYGSLAGTFRGHGSDLALIGGVLGFGPDDERIRQSKHLAAQAGLESSFHLVHDNSALRHPNLVGIALTGDSHAVSIMGASVGGGKVEILELDGFSVSLKGEEHTLVIRSWDRPGVITGISALLMQTGANIGNMAVSRAGKGQAVVMCIEVDMLLPSNLLAALSRIPGVNRVVWLEHF